MCIKKIFLLCFFVPSFAADKGISKPIESCGEVWSPFLAVVLYSGSEWLMQREIRNAVSNRVITDDATGRQGIEFAYTPEQRLVAQARQQGIGVGFLSTLGLLMNSGTPLTVLKGITNKTLFAQLLVPTVVYNATKEFMDATYMRSSSVLNCGVASVAASVVPKLFLASGISPERLIFHACLTHLLTHRLNKYRCTPILGTITHSCARASQVVPIMQMIASRYSMQSSLFTVHPVKTSWGEYNLYDDLKHGVIPGLVYVGVDLGINSIAASSVGKKIETDMIDPLFDIAVQLLPEKERGRVKKVSKSILIEGVKVGTTATILMGATGAGLV